MSTEPKAPHHRKLPLVPPMQCDKGCEDCCSQGVTVSEQEYQAVKAYAAANSIQPRMHAIIHQRAIYKPMCPWYHEGRCSVYDVRPAVCIFYGHAETAKCPRGYNTNLNETDKATFYKEMNALGPPVRLLHEILEEVDEAYNAETMSGINHNIFLIRDGIRAREGLYQKMKEDRESIKLMLADKRQNGG